MDGRSVAGGMFPMSSLEPQFNGNNPNFLPLAKQVKETKDHKEAALLVQSGNWVIVNAAFQGDDILWALIQV